MSNPVQDFYRIPSISQIKKVISSRNQILVRAKFKNESSKTRSGITKIGDTDFQPAVHANRISEVVMVPDHLLYHLISHKDHPRADESMPWRTDVQLIPGDLVWHSYLDSLNCPIIDVDDEPEEQYKLLNYYDLYVAKRKMDMINYTGWSQLGGGSAPEGTDWQYCGKHYLSSGKDTSEIIPLNGYVLCEEVMEERNSDMDVLDKHVDKTCGTVAFIGKANHGYRRERMGRGPVERDLDSGTDIIAGDTIIKKNPDIHVMLEELMYARFNDKKMYFLIQKKDIYAKISDVSNS